MAHLSDKDFFPGELVRAARQENLMKGLYGDDIFKGGEGSKGGKVIGHTKSGKPIYGDILANASGKKHNYSAQDHFDASKKISEFHEKHKGKSEVLDKHLAELSKHHKNLSNLKQATDIEKAEGDDIFKAEGGRGGKVIGHTSTGKPIYEHAESFHDYKFSKEEHDEAADIHKKEAEKYNEKAITTSGYHSKAELRKKAQHHFDHSTLHDQYKA